MKRKKTILTDHHASQVIRTRETSRCAACLFQNFFFPTTKTRHSSTTCGKAIFCTSPKDLFSLTESLYEHLCPKKEHIMAI